MSRWSWFFLTQIIVFPFHHVWLYHHVCWINRPQIHGQIRMKTHGKNPDSLSKSFLQIKFPCSWLYHHYILVGGFNHLEKYENQWEEWHHIYEMENKSQVWNHQSDYNPQYIGQYNPRTNHQPDYITIIITRYFWISIIPYNHQPTRVLNIVVVSRISDSSVPGRWNSPRFLSLLDQLNGLIRDLSLQRWQPMGDVPPFDS